MADKYALLAVIRQWRLGTQNFGVDLSDCIPVLEAALKDKEPAIRAMVEEWMQDVKADCAAQYN